jgi:FMN-dependent NADH-azoreductase
MSTGTTLLINSSPRQDESITRDIAGAVAHQVAATSGGQVVHRDVAEGLPFLTAEWVGAAFTPPEERTEAQHAALAFSDALVAELQAADTVVIGAPMYNFSVPAALKAWIDLVARAGVTFRYTPNGPKGLLSGKRAIVVISSGGVTVGDPVDFESGYLRHVLGFLGISDVEIVAATQATQDAVRADALRAASRTLAPAA